MTAWHISYCIFKRNKSAPWESGIAFLEAPGVSNVLTIIDSDHKRVKPWHYDLFPYRGAMTVSGGVSPQDARI